MSTNNIRFYGEIMKIILRYPPNLFSTVMVFSYFSGPGNIKSVTIRDNGKVCTKAPCELKKGLNASIDVLFIARKYTYCTKSNMSLVTRKPVFGVCDQV